MGGVKESAVDAPSERVSYLEEAATELELYGITVQDAPISAFSVVDYGLHDGNGKPYPLKGWSYLIKDREGRTSKKQVSTKICNYPDYPLYQKDKTEWIDRPDRIGSGYVYYATTRKKITEANHVVLHSDIASAVLCGKTLQAASAAFAGFYGWDVSGQLLPELASLIHALKPECRIVVCFGNELSTNSAAQLSAGRLKACISALRPDVSVVFAAMPTGAAHKTWADWYIECGTPELWVNALADVGVVVDEVIPLHWLVEKYGVSVCEINKETQLEQSLDNYMRLFRHPRWLNIWQDTDNTLYQNDRLIGSPSSLANEAQVWLERSVCQGYAGRVRRNVLVTAVDEYARSCKRDSLVLQLLKQKTEPVSLEAAKEAAHRLITSGLRVVAPMTQEQTVETVLRCFRDMVARWGCDRDVDSQWIWALVGKSGCGKSTFPTRLLGGLKKLGYAKPIVAQMEKNGTRASNAEYIRLSRSSLVCVMDDYNTLSEPMAKRIENELYQLTTAREVIVRDLYDKSVSSHMLHSVYFLTTTDTNKAFLKSDAGSGERRFITMEVEGHVEMDGRLVGDHDVIEHCGIVLMRWAAHGGTVDGSATEYSERHTGNYLSVNHGLEADLNAAIENMTDDALLEAMQRCYRQTTQDYRFTVTAFCELLNMRPISQSEKRTIKTWLSPLVSKIEKTSRVNDWISSSPLGGVLVVEKNKLPAFVKKILASHF